MLEQFVMKAVLTLMGGVALSVLAGCASTPQTADSAAKADMREERCHVTGSNLPKRDCRNDVTVLPPSAVDGVMPVLPSGAPRN